MCHLIFYSIWQQVTKQATIHTCMVKAVLVMWGLFRLTPSLWSGSAWKILVSSTRVMLHHRGTSLSKQQTPDFMNHAYTFTSKACHCMSSRVYVTDMYAYWRTVSVALIPSVSALMANTEEPVRRFRVLNATVVIGSLRSSPPCGE